MVFGSRSQRSGPPAPPDRVSVPKISPLTHIARCSVSWGLTFTFDLFDLYFISSGNVSNIERAVELPASAPLTVDSHLLEAGADEHAFTEATDAKVFRIGLSPQAGEDPARLGDLVKRVTNAVGSVLAAAGLEPVMTRTGLLTWDTDLQ